MATTVTTTTEKAQYLKQLETLSAEALKLLAEASKKPGIEAKLIKQWSLIKAFL